MTDVLTDPYETTVGLEVHVELSTRSKMFCACEVSFGGEPNTRTCPVCLGMPGSLPVPNEKAVEYTMRIAAALNCEIAAYSLFHRKNYFYPDMPKNYQISQYDNPLGARGYVEIEGPWGTHRVGITRVHLEEDTGKSIHVGGTGRIADSEYSLEDFNRAGTPLVEIVSEPDIRSARRAPSSPELRAILESLDVSDVRMEEGSMRVGANVSVRPKGPGMQRQGRGEEHELDPGVSARPRVRRGSSEAGAGGGSHWCRRRVSSTRRTARPPRLGQGVRLRLPLLPGAGHGPVRASEEWVSRIRQALPRCRRRGGQDSSRTTG